MALQRLPPGSALPSTLPLPPGSREEAWGAVFLRCEGWTRAAANSIRVENEEALWKKEGRLYCNCVETEVFPKRVLCVCVHVCVRACVHLLAGQGSPIT